MKILIIGSKGFIGSHCLEYFGRTNDVWGCDVVTDYNDKNYIQVDASNADYSILFEQNQFDVCINCSGAASVPDSIKNPKRDYYLNTVNVFLLLDAIRKNNINCKFLNLSTAAVYGNPEIIPIRESQSLKPVSPYGLHKRQAEEICEMFSKTYGLKTCSGRIFSAYGPGLKKQLFWDVFQKTRNQNNISFFGTGNETRDFIYIDDLVFALDCIVCHDSFNGDVINIANGEEVRIEEAIKTLLNSMGWKGSICFSGEKRLGDPINWCADISLLKQLNYKRKFSFKEGIEKYIEWLQEKN
jgi:dTDP-glucose 4,6-dehydratase/UDP-glucose 4-epimerase